MKSLDRFGPEKRVNDGRKACCKECCAIKARGREDYFKKFHRQNRERRVAEMRQYADLHREELRQKRREYYVKNRSQQLSSMAIYQRERRVRDPRFRLSCNFGTVLWFSIKHLKKGMKWEKIVGYTLDDLISHLSSKFKPGMNLENYGQWHVDHIIPRSLFSYTTLDDEQFRQCWSLSNLQPLWAEDNLKKRARIL